MSTGDVKVFNKAKLDIGVGNIHDFNSHTFKVALLDDTITPLLNDIDPKLSSYSEISDAGTYTLNGSAITITVSESNGIVTYDSTEYPYWEKDTNNPSNLRWGLIYNSTNVDQKALAFIDFGSVRDMIKDRIKIYWNVEGIFTLG